MVRRAHQAQAHQARQARQARQAHQAHQAREWLPTCTHRVMSLYPCGHLFFHSRPTALSAPTLTLFLRRLRLLVR
jgi:hypothetical protein